MHGHSVLQCVFPATLDNRAIVIRLACCLRAEAAWGTWHALMVCCSPLLSASWQKLLLLLLRVMLLPPFAWHAAAAVALASA
jgi:hypothetical protein